ncbi:hypothetical protein EGW08_004436 [Elysia chlorotica]|uniref:28S ribosomal protein S36, mitochondrial n=1 Tax=Elysia chlorotica TaxID=188477 RepID=A0A433U1S4_ELYCH|nr:hypothetical protein EGW08_004436 [Elysia chlorotica]
MPSLPFIARSSNTMMASVAARTTQAIRPHVPLIKFPPRNAVPSHSNAPKGATSHPAPTPNSTHQAPASSKAISKGATIESSSLPFKYQRKPISMEEMEYIEKGGPV